MLATGCDGYNQTSIKMGNEYRVYDDVGYRRWYGELRTTMLSDVSFINFDIVVFFTSFPLLRVHYQYNALTV
jgi:hypothetical protein